jgi:phosphoribosylamine--glycine ligase
MKILVIGSGGREHALVWKLAQSLRTEVLYCAPGNGGIADETLASNGGKVSCVDIKADDLEGLLEFVRAHPVDLTVVGPDNPLSMGIVDLFEEHGFKIWGPNAKAAQFEASKAFSQAFMERHDIPTARSGVFTSPSEALEFAASLNGRCAVKADGLALGKGVLMTNDMPGAEKAIHALMTEKAFGSAGNQVVIQEKLEGIEISMHVLCDGKTLLPFETSQDHKRALDGDKGLNTGGMGTYSPAPFLGSDQMDGIRQSILDPWLDGCLKESIDFRGMLYPGLMLTTEGPKVLEFNARFGDPETQVYLVRMQNDLPSLLLACVEGRLDEHHLEWSPQAATCVVMASGGYPEAYLKGKVISGIHAAESHPSVKVFHAGTMLADDHQLRSNGGRVLGVTALGESLEDATHRAYDAVSKIHFETCHFRRDIAAKAL